MLEGLKITLSVFFITLIISIPLGVGIAFLRLSKNKLVSNIANLYILIMRGTPLLLQLVFVFFGLPLVGIVFDRFDAVIVAFALNYAAYFAEIFRGGIESMPDGQYEAAKVLGYSRTQTFFTIIFPQVLKRILPALTNEIITLVKDTSLAYSIAYMEMFTEAKALAASFKSMIPFVAAAIFYYIFNFIVATIMEYFEKRMRYYD